jgi:hypothetical protein
VTDNQVWLDFIMRSEFLEERMRSPNLAFKRSTTEVGRFLRARWGRVLDPADGTHLRRWLSGHKRALPTVRPRQVAGNVSELRGKVWMYK